MKKEIIILLASLSFSVSIINSCDSQAKKVEDARENVQAKQENLAVAKHDLNQAIIDSTSEFKKFQKESLDRISVIDNDIAKLNAQMVEDKKLGKAKNQKLIANLKKKTEELKTELSDYKDDGKDNWKNLKVKFNREMDELGKMISNISIK